MGPSELDSIRHKASLWVASTHNAAFQEIKVESYPWAYSIDGVILKNCEVEERAQEADLNLATSFRVL